MRLTKAKTDKKDAKMIAAYGRTEKPKAWKAEAPYVIKLRQMQAYISQLDKSRTGYIRQMEAFNQSPIMSKEVKKGIEKMIACTESQIAALERSMEEIVSEHHQTMYEQIKSVPGIGR
jgi:transposase